MDLLWQLLLLPDSLAQELEHGLAAQRMAQEGLRHPAAKLDIHQLVQVACCGLDAMRWMQPCQWC
jgi:hypothetical protein